MPIIVFSFLYLLYIEKHLLIWWLAFYASSIALNIYKVKVRSRKTRNLPPQNKKSPRLRCSFLNDISVHTAGAVYCQLGDIRNDFVRHIDLMRETTRAANSWENLRRNELLSSSFPIPMIEPRWRIYRVVSHSETARRNISNSLALKLYTRENTEKIRT